MAQGAIGSVLHPIGRSISNFVSIGAFARGDCVAWREADATVAAGRCRGFPSNGRMVMPECVWARCREHRYRMRALLARSDNDCEDVLMSACRTMRNLGLDCGLVLLGLFTSGGSVLGAPAHLAPAFIRAVPLLPTPAGSLLAAAAIDNNNTASIPKAAGVDVLTYHNDALRSGLNSKETILTLTNVNAQHFGRIGFWGVDGKVDAQPLYLAHLPVPGLGSRNVLYVETEHDSVYAFDADHGTALWKVSLLGLGESPSDDRGCGQVIPEIGVTATPVIDRTRGPHGVIYVVAMSKDSVGNYFQRLHALDAALGTELFGGPHIIQASYPGTGDNREGARVVFDPKQYKERSALLLLDAKIYLGFASHCDIRPYTGWIMAYDAATLAQTGVLNVTPNGSEGAIWQSGAGLAADPTGNIYFLDANGTFDTSLNAAKFPIKGDFGNAFLKISTARGRLAAADYFATHDTLRQSAIDSDLGSGGAMILPDLRNGSGQVVHLALGAGKDSVIYVVDRDSMGKFNEDRDEVYQKLQNALGGKVFSAPAYFNHTVYFGAVGDALKAFLITNARLSNSAVSRSAHTFGFPGTSPAISADGSADGIVWAIENASRAVLHAYDATDLGKELYNSNEAGARDHFGPGNKFVTPTIVDGKVFVGTPSGVAVFGLLSRTAHLQ